jgi:hypothetical protein
MSIVCTIRKDTANPSDRRKCYQIKIWNEMENTGYDNWYDMKYDNLKIRTQFLNYLDIFKRLIKQK